jgi:hypothetical protein
MQSISDCHLAARLFFLEDGAVAALPALPRDPPVDKMARRSAQAAVRVRAKLI